MRQVHKIIDDAMDSIRQDITQQYNTSPVSITDAYDFKNHKSAEILRCVFRALHNPEEKLSFTVLKLIDAFLAKGVSEIADRLFMDGIQRIVSKCLQSHHGN